MLLLVPAGFSEKLGVRRNPRSSFPLVWVGQKGRGQTNGPHSPIPFITENLEHLILIFYWLSPFLPLYL
jgi:hypothetical protein